MSVEWLPIAEVPDSETLILGWEVGDIPRVCWRDFHRPGEGRWIFCDAQGQTFSLTPTHWLPVPPAPAVKP